MQIDHSHNEENKSIDKERDMIDSQENLISKKRLSGDFSENGKRALIIVPEDTEISEVAQMADIMRRAGITVVIASLDDSESVRSSSNILFHVDAKLPDALKHPPFDILVLPGGLLGAKYLGESKVVGALLKEYEENHRWIVAIGDAPPVLRKHFIGAGKTLTCHPLMRHKIEGSEYMKYKYVDDDVFVDGKIITCKGGPHTTQCALNLVHLVCGRIIAENVGKKLSIEYDDGYCTDCCGNCKYCCREDKKEIEPDIADRFACSTCCGDKDEDVLKWENARMMVQTSEKEYMIKYKLKREELRDLEKDRRIEKEEMENLMKEDAEEAEKWNRKWRCNCNGCKARIEKEKREYVEREETRYDEVMQKQYDRQVERHRRFKRRQDMIDTFRKHESAEIDDMLAQIDRQESVQVLEI